MNDAMVISLAQETLFISLLIASPMLGLGLTIGLVVSIFQTTTSIQEQTLTFIPKIVAVMFALAVFGGTMLNTMVDFMVRLFENMNMFTG